MAVSSPGQMTIRCGCGTGKAGCSILIRLRMAFAGFRNSAQPMQENKMSRYLYFVQ